jgi:hypothetical protein
VAGHLSRTGPAADQYRRRDGTGIRQDGLGAIGRWRVSPPLHDLPSFLRGALPSLANRDLKRAETMSPTSPSISQFHSPCQAQCNQFCFLSSPLRAECHDSYSTSLAPGTKQRERRVGEIACPNGPRAKIPRSQIQVVHRINRVVREEKPKREKKGKKKNPSHTKASQTRPEQPQF